MKQTIKNIIEALEICDLNEEGINCIKCPFRDERWNGAWENDKTKCYKELFKIASFALKNQVDKSEQQEYIKIPKTGIGDLSDGFHTFNDLYYQRMILFAAIVKANKDKAWKSYKHEDDSLCFGGGWFIVGIDTPEGSYTYHYENKYFDMFDCVELPKAKHWDGHTDKDVTRLFSLFNN